MAPRIQIGGRGVPGQHAAYPARPHGILPNNAGIGPIVQDRIDRLTAAASRRYKEAISYIDGVELYVWQLLYSGDPCVCGKVPDEPDTTNPHMDFIPDKTNAVDEYTDSLQVKTYDVSGYDEHMEHTKHAPDKPYNPTVENVLGDLVSSTSGDTDPYIKGSKSTGPYEGRMHGQGSSYLHQGQYDHEVPDSRSDIYGEELISEYEQDNYWNPDSILDDDAYVLGTLENTCPICFGTGYIGGYSLIGSTRIVLPAATSSAGSTNDFDPNAKPPVYVLQPDDYLTWTNVKASNYFTFGWAFALNLRKTVPLRIEYSVDNVNWFPIKAIGQHSTAPLNTLSIRVTNAGVDTIDFSHVDIMLTHTKVVGQVTNFNPASGLSAATKGNGITITLPPDVGIIDRNSLIGENKYRLMWRVLDLETVATHTRQVVSCTANTELLSPSYIETILYPNYTIEHRKQHIYGAGVEPIQGER